MNNSSFINEITVSYKKKHFNLGIVSCSNDAMLIARQVFTFSRAQISLKEYFFVLLLNRSNQVIGYFKLSEGGITETVADAG